MKASFLFGGLLPSCFVTIYIVPIAAYVYGAETTDIVLVVERMRLTENKMVVKIPR